MALKEWKCTECDKLFKDGDWLCASGMNHIVMAKIYRSLDVPTAEGRTADGSLPSIIRSRTRVCNIPPDKRVVINGEATLQPGGYVEFINGVFSTTDPEIQYWLDRKPGYQATEEQWKAVWLSADQRLADKELQLKAMETRLENERNELLASTQRKVKGETVAARG